ncbi:helix-turn-helix domain-containing protein [Emcibacter nanhaiensis]|uniref:Helix-turn-helix domain-containing protein n=1 Tax=Emcibacter nanhaiensis TaxID=1505037 RepID=A0A501PIA0_9PROT|nr:helix-turn-helix domain-containing protein [Emcibacter nanhaiensis]TPD60213.1 helix-turn-helix domain-containing protein [Emcibacter nanhaiensis]
MTAVVYSTSGEQDLRFWSTQPGTNADYFDEWSEMLRASHLPWTIEKKSKPDFNANLSVRSFCGYKLVQCACDHLTGFRRASEIANTNEAYFSILLLRKGREFITAGQNDLHLQENDILLWDSTQNMSFEVPERLEKTTLIIPETALTSVFPQAHDYAGTVISGSSGMGALLGRHIMSLHGEMWSLGENHLTSLMRPTLQILATALTGETEVLQSTNRRMTLARIKNYIVMNLKDFDLSPSRIASEMGISTRYLHILFREEGSTVSAWIKKCRLHKCREDLAIAKTTGLSITEIAYKWGFNDLSHFSKSFKEEFGLSPRAFQKH